MEWELNQSELNKIVNLQREHNVPFRLNRPTRQFTEAIIKAQAKKLVEWLDNRVEFVQGRLMLDLTVEDWERLRKEVGLD